MYWSKFGMTRHNTRRHSCSDKKRLLLMNRTINEIIMLTDTSEVLLAVSAYKRMPTQTREMVQLFAGDTDDHGDYDEHGQSTDGDGKYTMRMRMPSMMVTQ